MATYTFTYKVPDQLYVDSWADGNTGSGTVKTDQATHKAWFDRIGRGIQYSDFWEGIDSIGNIPPLERDQVVEIEVDPSTNAGAMALWHIKMNAYGNMMDSDEHWDDELVRTDVPNYAGHQYNKINNPGPQHIWQIFLDENNNIDYRFKNKFDYTVSDVTARSRRYEVEYFRDNYDCGDAIESDMTAFIAACDAYVEANADTKPWMLEAEAQKIDQTKAPKIPFAIAEKIATIKASGITADIPLVPWTATSEFEAMQFDPDKRYSELEG